MQKELGYKIAKVQRLFELCASPAAIMEKMDSSPAPIRRRKVSNGGGLKEEGEDIEVVETTLQQAVAMIAAGEIVDAKTVVLVQYLSNRPARR
jgi:hypothetical protein